jgi:hypothetical protein
MLRGARCFHDLLCAPRPSHIAGNKIGEAGCIALSSSLVHLSHLKELNLDSKFVWWSRVFVGMAVFACDFVLLFWVGYGCEGWGFDHIVQLFYFSFASCDTNFVVIMSSTPPPPCTIAAGIWRMQYYCWFYLYVALRALFSWSFVRSSSLTHCR